MLSMKGRRVEAQECHLDDWAFIFMRGKAENVSIECYKGKSEPDDSGIGKKGQRRILRRDEREGWKNVTTGIYCSGRAQSLIP